ncbi:SH3-like domain-containing protein [Elioraea sp.]|uniref:SH3-like domain-containing protein n=1 Tax=Elioraea sp. TaxID=2185103 RepID=UPI003F71D224
MSARFAPGTTVRVAQERPAISLGRQHIRTPHYVRGLTGTVAEVMGPFANPEGLAVGEDGLPKQVLYRVRFPLGSVWGQYGGSSTDTLDVELYEHWLEPAHAA